MAAVVEELSVGSVRRHTVPMIDLRNAKSSLLPVALVRYRFGSTANIPLHFRENNGRSLFFYPAALPHRDGQWIFVEFAVAGSDVPCLARGRVRTQQGANVVGSWLEFPMAGLQANIKKLAKTPRAQERLSNDWGPTPPRLAA